MEKRDVKLMFFIFTFVILVIVVTIGHAEIGDTIRLYSLESKGYPYERLGKDQDNWYIYTGKEEDVLKISDSDAYNGWKQDQNSRDYCDKVVLGYVNISNTSGAKVWNMPYDSEKNPFAFGHVPAGSIYELIDCSYSERTKMLWYLIIYNDLYAGWVSSQNSTFYVDTEYLQAETARQNVLTANSFEISYLSKAEQEDNIILKLSVKNNTDQTVSGITLNISVVDEDENIIATIDPQKAQRLKPDKTIVFEVQVAKGLNAYATYVDGLCYQEENGETIQLYYDDVETFYLTDNPLPEKPKIEITFGGTSEKTQTYGGSTSITSDSTINELIVTCPAIATAQKSTEEFYSSKTIYNTDFPSGSHAWKITIQNGVYAFSDEKETILLTVAAKGKPSDLIPVIKWEIKLLEAIPSVQKRASQLGITLTAEKRVNGGDYTSFADSSGVINLLNESKYYGVLEQEHSNLGTLEMIDAFSMLGD